MSISDISKKIKSYSINNIIYLNLKLKKYLNLKEDIFVVFTIIFIGIAGFGLGKLSALEKSREKIKLQSAVFTPISSLKNETDTLSIPKITKTPPMSASAMIASENAKGLIVASKSGKKYHFPWCAGASQITEKNKIWFSSYNEAISAGYTPASNCPGLK